jgi:hypothetical protein
VNRLAKLLLWRFAAANVNPANWRQLHMLDPLTSLVAARIKEARGNLGKVARITGLSFRATIGRSRHCATW